MTTPFSLQPAIRTPTTSNVDYIQCWNAILTPKWIRFRHLLSGNGKVHSDLAYPRLGIQRGQRVLDVACGFGDNTLELADAVGPLGTVTGLDCTQEFLEIATEEQHAAGVDNVSYLLGDIETAELPGASFDVAVSRFGIMYCVSPVRALRTMARALVPGGRVGLITWRALSENPFWSLAETIALRHLPAPGDDAQTCGPGPFSMASRDTNTRIMAASGFEQVEHVSFERPLCAGRTLDEAVEYQMLVGPAGYVIREAAERGVTAMDAIATELRECLAGHQREDGSVWLASSTWFITGSTPGR